MPIARQKPHESATTAVDSEVGEIRTRFVRRESIEAPNVAKLPMLLDARFLPSVEQVPVEGGWT
jgi:hypothetical protein